MGKCYKVNIETPNLFIVHKRRQLRTPVSITVPESEIELIKMKIRQIGTPDYSIEEIKENNYITPMESIEFKDEVIVDESFEKKPQSTSILDILLDEK